MWVGTEVVLYSSAISREAQAIPRPNRTRTLAMTADDVSVTRVDEVTLRLRSGDGFFAGEARQLLRGPSRPFRQGDVIRLSDMTATVEEVTHDQRPGVVVFRFAEVLESPTWLWMRDNGGGFVAWTPPAVGKTVVLPAGR